ncbi:transmembrane protein 230 isoform X2 [Octopus bimaculoides]|uniref:Transmembrane protein 230 n=1 Tax=Octopus bimaculoides TaxID=37653 RepID=A0A0L8GL64_OCTBM|nr:transmembrane protein 230 isoform X2 [Octopus bimaculoides]|eukprot:XP_014780029.1 PREDICTED: transmembrane protein 230-like isoform X2 [Octopus bimaculoides]
MTKKNKSDYLLKFQFEKPPPKIPYKAIALATALFAVGTLLITIGALLLTGHISSEYSDRTWPLLILGALMFIPGSYHVMIAYYAYKGYEGYSFEDIPDFD